MKLKPVIDSLEGLAAEQHSLYQLGDDGKYHLIFEVELGEDERRRVTSTLEKAREEKNSAERRAREVEQRLAEYGDATPEEIVELRKSKEEAAEAERLREQETAKSREDWNALIEAERTRGEKRVKESVDLLQGRITELDAVIEHLVLSTALSRSAAQLPVRPNFVPLYMSHSREVARVIRPTNGSGQSVRVNGKDVPIPEVVVMVDDIPVPFDDWAKNHFARSPMGQEIVLEPQDTGGDAGSDGTRKRAPNPFSERTFNLTEQGKLERTNPALAARFRAEAQATAG